jgi:ABC-type branched-subunit amino acid transport system ATPase component/ABC-type branched-subunit amino acid transport system permease subunit
VFFVTVTLVQTILLASLNLALGYAGLVSLGHNALFAIGGYATAYFTITKGLPVAAGIPLGMAFGTLAGATLALPAYRARAIYFGIITLAFLFITFETVSKWPTLGGFRGFPNVGGLSIGGVRFGRNEYYWFALGVFVLALGLLQQLCVSAIGRSFVAVRENEAAAASLGIDVFGTKVLNLAISGGLAGLAGALFAHLSGGIFPEAASFVSGFRLFVAIVVGGVGTFAGPLVGTAVVATVDRLTVNWTTAQPILFGVMLIGSLAVMRLGIVGSVLTSRWAKLFVRIAPVESSSTQAPPARAAQCKGSREALLRVQGLAKHFDGVQALVNVDITVARGTIHGLIGPNGSGKTTFVNCLTGYLRRDAGRIWFDGQEIAKPRPHRMARAGVVRIFQKAESFGRLLVIQNVLMGLHLRSDRNLLRCVVPAPARRRAERRLIVEALEILSSVGLADRALSPVRSLPYGQQRLVEIARAIATRPRLLILDEPATGLTAVELVALTSLLRSLRARGLTILVIEHNMDFLMDLVERVTVLESGECIAVGEPMKIQRNPAVIEAYLGERIPA